MPYSSPAETGDFEKLQLAFKELTSTFGSMENLLEAFGLADLPSAQRYGIIFGFLVFVGTVTAVLALLTLGGSFERMAEQTKTGSVTIAHDFKARMDRPLLLERLLDSRERLMRQNYPNRAQRKEGCTNLTKTLLNIPPPKNAKSEKDDKTGYMKNYVVAYRKCQDQPGGM
jgi:Na+/pantothenate symporter